MDTANTVSILDTLRNYAFSVLCNFLPQFIVANLKVHLKIPNVESIEESSASRSCKRKLDENADNDDCINKKMTIVSSVFFRILFIFVSFFI